MTHLWEEGGCGLSSLSFTSQFCGTMFSLIIVKCPFPFPFWVCFIVVLLGWGIVLLLNTNKVIKWFKDINNKPRHSFICFDICEFYPSISEELLTNALEFAQTYDPISDEEKEIICHTKKALLYNKDTPWCKKGNTNLTSPWEVTTVPKRANSSDCSPCPKWNT